MREHFTDRQLSDVGKFCQRLWWIRQLNRARHVRFSRDHSFLFERFQMTHHPIGRFDFELLPYFANSRPVTASHNLVAQEIVDLLLSVCQCWLSHFGDLHLISHPLSTREGL